MEIVWSAIILTLLPWIGSLPAGMATRKQIKTWYNVSFPNFDLYRIFIVVVSVFDSAHKLRKMQGSSLGKLGGKILGNARKFPKNRNFT